MGKIIYSMMVSLDGFIESPNHSLDWVLIDEELHRFVNERERSTGAFLYGRRTYETMASYWPTADTNPASTVVEVEYARIWQSIPLIVFSRTLDKVEGDARLVREIIPEEVARLKAEFSKDLAVGGANLASTFMQLGLIDEYQIYIQPVILGGGTPLFAALKNAIELRLVETRTFGSGVVFLSYQSGRGE